MCELKKILKIKQMVRIELIGKNKKAMHYKCCVEDVDEQIITLSLMLDDPEILVLPSGTSLNIWCWNIDAIYIIHSVLCADLSEANQIVKVKVEKISRVQKREYVRVGYVLDVLVFYLNEQNEEEVILCKSQDISGGGMMLVLDIFAPLKKGTKVRLKFSLNNTIINAEGKIVWNEWKLDNHGDELNYIGVMFKNILEKYRKIIIKSVYDRQIELRRKGLL